MPSPTMVVEAFAAAKVNLTLHVTGQRADGYHLLDSLVVFADVGDHISVRAADRLSLTLAGPQAADLSADDDNLVLRAARFLAAGFVAEPGAALTLTKVLPISSGIGGGSADAAATLRALSQLWSCPLPEAAATLALGADVPVCLAARSRRMSGIGEHLAEIPVVPPAWLVLVNPAIEVSTPTVFGGLAAKSGAPMPQNLPRWADVSDLARFLASQRNDLESFARQITPEIGAVLDTLSATPDCHLARMSGSGATCFGLFSTDLVAKAAAKSIAKAQPHWWVVAAKIL